MDQKIERLDQIPSCDALSIIIGFDYAKESGGPCASDVACLSVVRKNGEVIELISQFYGEEALWLYARLINGPMRHPSYMRSEMFHPSPLYMTMPKGLGLTEAKENFKRYINGMYGAPNENSFEVFRRSFKDCEITRSTPDKDGNIEIRFNFGEDQNFLHLAYQITERQRVNTPPAKMEHDICRRALEDLERSMKK